MTIRHDFRMGRFESIICVFEVCPFDLVSFDHYLGGHTAEMLNLLAVMQMERFKPRYYIAAATDNMSLQKARVMEDNLKNMVKNPLVYSMYRTSYFTIMNHDHVVLVGSVDI